MFLPNLDGDTVDACGRRKDGCHGTAQKIRHSSAVLLALGGWCSGGTAFRRGHFLRKREVSKICQLRDDQLFFTIHTIPPPIITGLFLAS